MEDGRLTRKLSPLKRSKSSGKEYFDLQFQTEKNPIRAVCFSPDKWRKLNEYQESETSCELRNLDVRKSSNDYFITQRSVVKPKKVLFKKDEKIESTSIDQIINELPLFTRVHVKAKVISLDAIKLEEYDGKKIEVRQVNISDGKDQFFCHCSVNL